MSGPSLMRRGAAVWMLFAVVCAWGSRADAASDFGSLAGTVVDDTGASVGGARVTISFALPQNVPHPAAPPVVTGPLAATAVADARGLFSIPSLPPGEYVACAEATAPGLLNPCHWATAAPVFGITPGKETTGVKITLARGATLPVSISDPKSLLTPAKGDTDLNLQVHIVTAKGVHHNVPIQSSTGLARNHVATVPFGTAVTVQILAANLTVNDQTGKVPAVIQIP